MLLFDPGGWAVPIPIPVPVPIPQVPKPPTGSWYWRLVEQWAYYLRTRWLIPNNVTTPPNNWPGTVGPWFNAFFALLYVELNFPASLADGTLEGKPVRLPDAPIGTNPVPEFDRGTPTPPVGTFTYQNIKEFFVKRHRVMVTDSGNVIDRSHTFWVRNDHYSYLTGPYLADWESRAPAIIDVRRKFDGYEDNYEFVWTSVAWVTDIFTDVKKGSVQGEAAHGVWHFDEGDVGGPYSRFPDFGVETSWEEIIGYIPDPTTFPGDYPAQPITPMPDPYPAPVPIPQPSPRVEPLPMTEVAPQPIRPRVRRPPTTTTDKPDSVVDITAPPIPADFDVVAPAPLPLPNVIPSPTPEKITETDLDGLPIPAPGITTKVTDALQHFPWPGAEGIVPGGVPSTLKGIANEIGRVEAKTSMIGAALEALSGIGGGGGGPEKEVDGTTYTLTGVCETPNDAGAQPVFSTPIGTQPYSDAVIARLDAMQYLLQAHLGFKTPICGSTKPQLFPFWRSIRFESAEKTANGRDVARKLLRYRGDSAGDVDFLGEYWADFEWETGPVIVFHKGTPVGTPKVWAATEAEGQRVLRHAFREAGIDPDQTGQWGVSGSDHPRYGVRHTVRLACIDGCWSATARPGPNGWPEASVAWPDS